MVQSEDARHSLNQAMIFKMKKGVDCSTPFPLSKKEALPLSSYGMSAPDNSPLYRQSLNLITQGET